MHVVTGMIVMFGMQVVWEKLWLRLAGTLALLSISMVFHAVYNILVSQPGAPAYVGYFVPIATAVVTLILKKRADKHKENTARQDQFSV
jgi:hypothetical protein